MNPSELPLYSLAVDVVRKADMQGLTPVLAVEKHVVLSDDFMRSLLTTLFEVAERPVRLETLLRLDGVFGFWRARQTDRLACRLTKLVPEALRPQISVERRTVLSRAAGVTKPLVVGIAAGDDPLPEWASRIRLTMRASHQDEYQLVPRPLNYAVT